MLQVVLPWPQIVLNPNQKVHWARKAKAAKVLRTAAWACTLSALEGQKLERKGEIDLHITFSPPDRRHRDEDNMLASLKAGLDGIAQALDVNDRQFRIRGISVSEPVKLGSVVVQIGGTSETNFTPRQDER